MQKIKRTVDTLYTEKQKFDKEKSKKGGKGKGKANLRMESDNVGVDHLLLSLMRVFVSSYDINFEF